MRSISKEIKLTEYDSTSELSSVEQELINEAVKSANLAYAPYSKFPVGCALLLEDGTIIKGNNQENLSSPLGQCAEGVTFFAAHANYPDKKIIAAAVYSPLLNDPITPCGGCRQIMYEYEQMQKSPIKLFMLSKNLKIWAVDDVKTILPLGFSMDGFNRGR